MNPSSLPELSRAVAGAVTSGATLVTGVVVRFTAQGLLVAPGGFDAEPVLAGWMRGIYQPVLGETVALLNQGGMWFCVGPIGGPFGSADAIANYSFEESDPNVFPTGWTLVNTVGSPTLVTALWVHPEIIDGGKVALLSATATATITSSLVSSPVPVEPGQTWGMGAFYRPNANFGANAGTIRIFASWYSDSSLSSLISEESAVTFPLIRGHGWRLVTENGANGWGSVAPSGANYLRAKITVSWSAINGDAVILDRVTARRTT